MDCRKMIFPLFIVLSMLGCKTDWDKQQAFLLPKENVLKIASNEDTEMVTINVFSVSGILSQDSLANYPLQKIEGKAIKKWHRVSKQEIKDLEDFFQNEPIADRIKTKVLECIKDGSCYVAYMFNFNEKAPPLEKGYAHKDHNPIPGEKGYNTMSWIDMYFLDTDTKELIHISFGKF